MRRPDAQASAVNVRRRRQSRLVLGPAIAVLVFAAACGGGGTSTGAMSEPGADHTSTAAESGASPEPGEATSDGGASESAGGKATAGSPPSRPPTADVPVTVEMAQVSLPCVLLAPARLPFSTYLFEEFQAEPLDNPLPGVRVADNFTAPRFLMEVVFYPEASSQDDAARAFAKAVAEVGGAAEEGVPMRPWARESATVDHGDTADVFFLGTHGGRWFTIHQQFEWASVEQFGGVLDAFLKEWQWSDDGTYLVGRSG